jgi:threonylcarbamoyladenosine tRNA methylthiotransferase MtaB
LKVYLTSLGCKLNQSEIESLARRFLSAGHQVVSAPEEADVGVVNTCTVTRTAARKTRQMIRRLHRANPQLRMAVTGCHAEIFGEETAGLPGVRWVVGNRDKDHLPNLVDRNEQRAAPPPPGPFPGRTRAFVKIQDGCDNHCSYCVVAIARGKQRSRPQGEVVAEILSRESAGYKEAVLTGVHIGAFGRERGGSLAALVERILDETSIPRLRLSSIEPWDLSEDLLELWQDRRLCRHLHLPLQSGSGTVLRRMGRRYSPEWFADWVGRAKRAVPGLAVTTDVIVGFPGETDEEFQESYRLAADLAFARIHVFPYSPRPGTAAAGMPDHVPDSVKRARSPAMLALADESALAFRKSFFGRTLDVLWERSGRRGEWVGLTDNYLRVLARSEENLTNTIRPVRLVGCTDRELQGMIAGDLWSLTK